MSLSEKVEDRWEHAGLECVTVRNPFGGLNAYVRLPEPFRTRKMYYDDLGDVSVSGGLTYGMDDEGFVGWDTCHFGDTWASPEEIRPSMRDSLASGSGYAWDRERVIEENTRLAEQIAAWCERNPDFEGEFTERERMEQARERLRLRAKDLA